MTFSWEHLSKKIDRSTVQWTGLFAGPALGVLTYLLLPDTYQDSRGATLIFTSAGHATAATGVWMVVWWITEAIPVYATALLPIALLPATGAVPIHKAASPYGHELIFLFMGGFIIALSMQRWGLHRRIALAALRLVGTGPTRIVGGFMGITAVLSMWVSNTATTIMMLPIALSVIGLVRPEKTRGPIGEASEKEGSNFAVCLLLSIAYASSIGGIGTLIGTPPNLFLASFIQSQLGVEISFVRWMGIGIPIVAAFLPLTWLLMTHVFYPPGSIRIEGAIASDAYRELGAMKPGEWASLIVFLLTAMAWMFRRFFIDLEWNGSKPFSGISDPVIGIIAALALFVIPLDLKKHIFVMNWETAVKLPWGLLVLFGGGLSLAAAIKTNGVGEFLGSQVGGLVGIPPLLMVLLVTALMIFLTELTSNTATTATLIPILFALAPGLGMNPFLMIVPAAIAASCAFMLPVATPPNAIVFGSGNVTIPQMCRAGLWLNLIGIVLITALTYTFALRLLGVDQAITP